MNIINRCTHAFGVPGSDSLLDFINPDTGRSLVNNSTLAEIQERAPGAVVVLIADHIAAKAARQNEPVTWEPTTAERYHEALNVLPPERCADGGFLVGEPMDHHASTGQPRFTCYRHNAGEYTVSSRPITCAEFAKLV